MRGFIMLYLAPRKVLSDMIGFDPGTDHHKLIVASMGTTSKHRFDNMDEVYNYLFPHFDKSVQLEHSIFNFDSDFERKFGHSRMIAIWSPVEFTTHRGEELELPHFYFNGRKVRGNVAIGYMDSGSDIVTVPEKCRECLSAFIGDKQHIWKFINEKDGDETPNCSSLAELLEKLKGG